MGASRSSVPGFPRRTAVHRTRARVLRPRRWGWVLAALVLLVPDIVVPARPAVVMAAPPSFAGTWVYAPSETAAPDSRGFRPALRPTGLCAARCTIAQSAESLTLIRSAPAAETATYRFDGVERPRLQRHPLTKEEFAISTRVVWEGAALAFYSTAAGRRPGRSRTALSLEDGLLVVENWIEQGGRLTTRRLVYRRALD